MDHNWNEISQWLAILLLIIWSITDAIQKAIQNK